MKTQIEITVFSKSHPDYGYIAAFDRNVFSGWRDLHAEMEGIPLYGWDGWEKIEQIDMDKIAGEKRIGDLGSWDVKVSGRRVIFTNRKTGKTANLLNATVLKGICA